MPSRPRTGGAQFLRSEESKKGSIRPRGAMFAGGLWEGRPQASPVATSQVPPAKQKSGVDWLGFPISDNGLHTNRYIMWCMGATKVARSLQATWTQPDAVPRSKCPAPIFSKDEGENGQAERTLLAIRLPSLYLLSLLGGHAQEDVQG